MARIRIWEFHRLRIGEGKPLRVILINHEDGCRLRFQGCKAEGSVLATHR